MWQNRSGMVKEGEEKLSLTACRSQRPRRRSPMPVLSLSSSARLAVKTPATARAALYPPIADACSPPA